MRSRVFRLGTHQSAAFTSASNVVSSAFAAGTNVVRVVATKGCYLNIGNTLTAAATDVYLPADKVEYFIAAPGMRASAIRVATNGTLHITELSG